MKSYADLEQTIWVQDGAPSRDGKHDGSSHGADRWAVVGACGNTEFGRFCSLGRLDTTAPLSAGGEGKEGGDEGRGGYTRLTLARRYLADDDPRTRMSAREVVRRVAGAAAGVGDGGGDGNGVGDSGGGGGDGVRVSMSGCASAGLDERMCQAPWLALPWKVPEDWPWAPLAEASVRALLDANRGEAGTEWCVGVTNGT